MPIKVKKVKAPKSAVVKMKNDVAVGPPVMPGMEVSKQPDKYEVDNWLKTITDAHEISADPEKMKHVNKRVGRHKKAIASLKDLKDAYQSKYGVDAVEDEEEEDLD